MRYVTYLLVANVLVRSGDTLEAVGAALGLGRVIAYAVAETAKKVVHIITN